MNSMANVRTEDMDRARAELERRRQDERGRYYIPNGRIEQFINQAKLISHDGHTYIFILRAGNGIGKTACTVNLANYLTDHIPNPYLDSVPYLKNFKRPNVGRIYTTANAAKNTYDKEIPKWFSKGAYTSEKRNREFNSFYRNKRTNSEFDIFTFEQDPMAGESITLDWAIVDEPMSRRHWAGLKSRFRFGGIIFFVLTPLEGSGWYHDELETEERIGKDVFVMEGSSEDNCIEHGVRGIMPHAALEDMWKDFDEAELPARRDGKYLHMSGVIYKTYRSGYTDEQGNIIGHEPDELLGYYRECWALKKYRLYNIIDPHDRKPWAVGWHVTFPNQDTFVVGEWPDESYRPYHKLTDCTWGCDQYAKMIQETEKLIGKPADVRLMDPNFGRAPKATTKSTIAQEIRLAGQEIGYPLIFRFPSDDIKRGHLLVKEDLGNPAKGIRPKLFVMQHCKNHRFAMTHYGWKENRGGAADSKGISEKPELIHKDFADLVRYGKLFGYRYIEPDPTPPVPFIPRRHGSGYVGA